MQVPKSLNDTWAKVTQDKSISKEDYMELVKAAVPNGKDEELDEAEAQFLTGLKSELERNDIATKGTVPVGVLNFGEEQGQQAPVTAKKSDAPAETPDEQTGETETAPQNNTAPVTARTESASGAGLMQGRAPISFPIPEPQLPTAPVLLDWPGYSKQVNTAFATAFGEKPPAGNQIPVLSNGKAAPIIEAFGAGNIKQLQQAVGAKQDSKFGPETYFRAKTHVASQINSNQDVQKLTQLKSILGVLGNDPEVDKMKTILDQRISAAQDFLNTRQALQNYFDNINSIVGHADPKNMESLVKAKGQLGNELGKLPQAIQGLPQVVEAHQEANKMVDDAIKALQGDLDSQDLLKQKQALVSELNGVLNNAVTAGLTKGDANIVKEGKNQVEATVNKYPKVKDAEDIKALKQQALGILDATSGKIDTINALIKKPDWTAEDNASATKFLGELPPGEFKNKLAAAIESHSDAAKLKDKNRKNLPTTMEGLHDVIGNGFWNLENKDGTKGLFQLVARQGLLPEAITKMTVDDQTEAIKLLTKGIKFDKLSDGDNFNLGIARSIYENLSKSANVDKEINDKVLIGLKKEPAPQTFGNYNMDLTSYVKGMKFSIGADRIGSEQEAALTMARGIMNGEVSRAALGQLSRYDLNELTQFVEKKGSKEEKNVLLNTVAKAYNDGIKVNIDSLDKGDKAVVVKGVLDIDGVNESKVSDLLKKAGKKTIFETVRNQNLNDKQLTIVGKHVDGDDMADEPDVGAKILVGMVKTYNKQEDKPVVQIDDIRKYIDQVDNDWWEDDDTMKLVLKGLGDGTDSEYAKFQKLAPQTLDKIWKIAD
jgi:hypothetical protein